MTRRVIALLFLSAAAVASADPVAITPAPAARHGVHIHAARTVDSAILGTIRYGQVVLAHNGFDAKQPWCPVMMRDGRAGYANTEYVQQVDGHAIPFDVRFLDVGTGQAAIVRAGESELIIDGGPDRNTLLRYLRRHNLSRHINLIATTNAAPGHWRGLSAVIAKTNVDEVWLPPAPPPCAARVAGRLRATTRARICTDPLQCRGRISSGNTVWLPQAPEVTISVFTLPPASDAGRPCTAQIGSASIVLRLSIGDTAFLFTGDISGKRRDFDPRVKATLDEAYLLAKSGASATAPDPLRADVVVVANHGAETASTKAFIKRVAPRFAIISANPRFRIPSDSVADRYRDADATVLQTFERPGTGNDDIICRRDLDSRVQCSFADALTE